MLILGVMKQDKEKQLKTMIIQILHLKIQMT